MGYCIHHYIGYVEQVLPAQVPNNFPADGYQYEEKLHKPTAMDWYHAHLQACYSLSRCSAAPDQLEEDEVAEDDEEDGHYGNRHNEHGRLAAGEPPYEPRAEIADTQQYQHDQGELNQVVHEHGDELRPDPGELIGDLDILRGNDLYASAHGLNVMPE